VIVNDEIVRKAARLAAVYGDDWNSLSQDERRKYINCVDAYFNPRFKGAPAVDRIEAVVDSVALSLGQISHPSPAHAGAGAEALAEETAIRCGARVDRARGTYTLTGEQLRAVARRLAGGDHA